MTEAFSALLSKAFHGGLLEGFDVGDHGFAVSHLQFTDDTLVLCKNSVKQINLLICVIRCFEEVLG